MDVQCPHCSTLFEFDERQMRGAYATLQCSVCATTFRVETTASVPVEDARRWMVRDAVTGDLLYFESFEILHRWIVEGKVSRGDAISRTGGHWTVLDTMGELAPLFEVLESISSAKGYRPPQQARPALQIAPVVSVASSAPRAPSALGAPPVWDEGEETTRPEWHFGEPTLESARYEPSGERPAAAPRSPIGLIVAVALSAALIGGGAVYWLSRPAPPAASVSAPPPIAAPLPAPSPPPPERAGRLAAGIVAERAGSMARARWLVRVRAVRLRAGERFERALESAASRAKRATAKESAAGTISSAKRALDRGDHGEAVKRYREVLSASPRDPNALVGLGWAYLAQGSVEEAEAQFRKAMGVSPGSQDSYIGLGKSLRTMGRLREALKIYERYLEKFPSGRRASIATYQRDQLRKTLGI